MDQTNAMKYSEGSRVVDLNADLGEGLPNDIQLLDAVTSTSICCGAYAGDRATLLKTMGAASDRQVVIGAHPGYPDRKNFGRIPRSYSTETVERLVREQLEIIQEEAEGLGATIRFVKPHGALYNQAVVESPIAEGIVRAVAPIGWAIVTMPHGRLREFAEAEGLRVITEGFVDRRYRDDGRLVSRSEPNSRIERIEDSVGQAIKLITQGIETLCIHGDDPAAVERTALLRRALEVAGIRIQSPFSVATGADFG